MLVEITDFTGLSISPDGRYGVYRAERASVEDNDYSSAWFVFRLGKDEPPRRIADGGAPLFSAGWALGEWPRWSSDARSIYFRALINGEAQIWRATLAGEARRVTDDPADIQAFALLAGEVLAYETGPARAEIRRAEIEEYDAGVRIDETVPVGQGLFRSGLVHGRLATQRYLGDWMNVTTLLGDRASSVTIHKPGKEEPRAANKNEEAAFRRLVDGPTLSEEDAAPGRSARMHVNDDGRIAYIEDDRGAPTLRARLDAETASEIVCAAPACGKPVSWLAWRGARNEVVFATKDGERGNAQTLYSWDVEENAVREIRQAPGLLDSGRLGGRGPGCAVSEDHAVCIAADANRPPRIVEIDLETGAVRIVADPNASLARALDRHAEFLRWQDEDGRDFTGYFIPAAGAAPETPAPLFITYYTCQGYLRGGFGDEWPLVHLAEAGVSTLCINMPPLDDKTGADGGSLVTREYDIALGAVKSAVDRLAPRGVDRDKIAMGGFSFGASVVMWTAYHSDLLAAASLATPEISETYYWQRALMGETFKKTLKNVWGLGAPGETPGQWSRFSPSDNLDRLRFPLLMQLAEQEYLVAAEYFAPLMNSGAPTEVYVFPHEPHYKMLPRHRLAAYRRNLDWFRFWLLDKDAGAGVREAQFARWRAMRARLSKDAAPRGPKDASGHGDQD